jgi:glycerol-3-phosphate cytidylyltransferase
MANQTVGFTCSTFDLLHAGHIMMLREASSVCDHLIVGLQTDPTVDRPEKNKPVQSINERIIQLFAVKWIDEIYIYETENELMQLLENLPIDVRIVGEDYLGKDFTGKSYHEQNDHRIYYNSRKHNYSSTELRQRIIKQQGEN